jgi:hypothetical protein
MRGLDRRFDLVAAARARRVRLMQEVLRPGDQRVLPEIRVLAFERDVVAGGVVPDAAASRGVEHQFTFLGIESQRASSGSSDPARRRCDSQRPFDQVWKSPCWRKAITR